VTNRIQSLLNKPTTTCRIHLSELLKEQPSSAPPTFWVETMTAPDGVTILAGDHEGTWENLIRHCMTVGRSAAKRHSEDVIVVASVDGLPCYAIKCASAEDHPQ